MGGSAKTEYFNFKNTKKMKNLISTFIHHFDTFDDVVSAIVAIFSLSFITAVFGSMLAFLSSGVMDYVMIAFFGVIGQLAMYFAKIRFPSYFGKHDEKKTLGTKILHLCIDCFLAAFFSVLCTEYLVDFIFTTLALIQNIQVSHSTEDYKRTITGAIIVGAFYETILKKAIKKNKEIDEEITEQNEENEAKN